MDDVINILEFLEDEERDEYIKILLKEDGRMIKHVKDPTPEMQILAVKQNPTAFCCRSG